MSSDVCPHCGNAVEGGHAIGAARGELPVVPDISSSTSSVQTPIGGGANRSRGVPPWAVVALGLVALAAVAWALFGGSGSDTASDVEAEEPAVADAAIAETANPDDAGPGAVDANVGIQSSLSTLFDEWLDDGRDWTVAYPSPMGLQILSADGVSQPTIEVATGFEEAAQLPLLSDGSTTWAVDPATPQRAWLVSTRFVVIDIDRDGRVGFINDSLDPPNIGESSFGAWGPGFDLPPDAEVIAVAGRGLFVLPSIGGTYLYKTNGVIPVSDDRMVAASIDSEIFERCNETLTCELYVVSPERPEPTVLAEVPLDARLWLAPQGRWLVATDDGSSTMYDLVDGAVIELPEPIRSVDWAGDASVAALLGGDNLWLFRASDSGLASAVLPIAPSAGAVLLTDG